MLWIIVSHNNERVDICRRHTRLLAIDLSFGKVLFLITQLLPTSDSQVPLISTLQSHMSIKGLRALE